MSEVGKNFTSSDLICHTLDDNNHITSKQFGKQNEIFRIINGWKKHSRIHKHLAECGTERSHYAIWNQSRWRWLEKNNAKKSVSVTTLRLRSQALTALRLKKPVTSVVVVGKVGHNDYEIVLCSIVTAHCCLSCGKIILGKVNV